MKSFPIYQVDSFAEELFKGNPATVCPLEEWLPTETMKHLAEENNTSETAFFIRNGDIFHIRWFTADFEVDLAGHPTLAAAHVIFNEMNYNKEVIHFECNSGSLFVKQNNGMIELNLPARMPEKTNPPLALIEGISKAHHKPEHIFKSRDYFLVYEDENEVKQFMPDFGWLNQLKDAVGIIITAKSDSDGIDFVSRFFVLNSRIGEDQVTGSSHSSLVPYWSKRLNKTQMVAKQMSKRGGILYCEDKNDRVTISGKAILYMKGEYYL